MKASFFFILFFIAFAATAQDYKGSYISNQKDTIAVLIKRSESIFPLLRTMEMQESITVIENGTVKRLTPKEITSFSVHIKEEIFIFDSLDGLVFGQRLYVKKLKLYKCLQKFDMGANGQILKVYLLQKPGETNMHKMISHGFSRLLNKNEIMPIFADCKSSQDKLENDSIKIKNEEKLVAFIQDYEATCFK